MFDPKYNAFREAAQDMLLHTAAPCYNPTPAAITVLARDLQDLSETLDATGYNGDVNNAVVVLRRRIGGQKNIWSYVNSLLAQTRGSKVGA